MAASRNAAGNHVPGGTYNKQHRAIPVIQRGLSTDQVLYDRVVVAMAAAPSVTVITGAGISTSAGIPDFRSAEGLYNAGLPNMKDEVLGSDIFNIRTLQDPKKLLTFGRVIGFLRKSSRDAQPTSCHYLIAKLHKLGCLARCYTQNIDGLQTRGRPQLSEVVLELHGNIQELHCNRCGQSPDRGAEEIDMELLREGLSYCTRCHSRGTSHANHRWTFRPLPPGLLLPRVLHNEESREIEFNGMTMDRLEKVDGSASLLLVIGTSIRTDGAAKLVRSLAKKVHQTGGTVVYVDRSKLQDSKWRNYFDLQIQAEIDDWAQDYMVYLTELTSEIDSKAKLRELVQALLDRDAGSDSGQSSSSLVTATGSEGLSPKLPRTELIAHPISLNDESTVILVCHSGAAPSLARAMALEMIDSGKKHGQMCYGYVVVLLGSEDDLDRLPVRENFKLVVVHISDYMLRLHHHWRPIEPRQTIQEVSMGSSVKEPSRSSASQLLNQSVHAVQRLSKLSNGQFLLMLCAEDELLDQGAFALVHNLFRSQSVFNTMIASLNMSRLRTSSWARFTMDIISSHCHVGPDPVNQMAVHWMKNSDLIETSDFVVFSHDVPTAMLIASRDDRPLGKPLPDIGVTCPCRPCGTTPSNKEWEFLHNAADGCVAKQVSARVQCSWCKRIWSLGTSSMIGTIRRVEGELCVVMQYDGTLGWV